MEKHKLKGKGDIINHAYQILFIINYVNKFLDSIFSRCISFSYHHSRRL
jgi:hypothetical protein